MKEYHLFRITDNDDDAGYEQAFITSVTRDNTEHTVLINEVFIITCIDGKTVKLRIDMEYIYSKVADQYGGNIPQENLDKMFDELDEVIPPHVQLKNQIDLFQMECPDSNADLLIMAATAACSAHPTDFDIIIQEKLNENTPRIK